MTNDESLMLRRQREGIQNYFSHHLRAENIWHCGKFEDYMKEKRYLISFKGLALGLTGQCRWCFPTCGTETPTGPVNT